MTPSDTDAPRPARTPQDWQDRISTLERRRQAVAVSLARTVLARRSAAASATPEQLEGLNVKAGALAAELDQLSIAKEFAAEQLAAVLEDKTRGGLPARRPDAAAIGKALLSESRRADLAMTNLVQALIAREALARRLAGLGRSHPQLENPARLHAAALYAGLAAYLPLNRAPERLLARLSDADGVALHGLIKPPSAEKQEHAA